jgi:hypothetical protein
MWSARGAESEYIMQSRHCRLPKCTPGGTSVALQHITVVAKPAASIVMHFWTLITTYKRQKNVPGTAKAFLHSPIIQLSFLRDCCSVLDSRDAPEGAHSAASGTNAVRPTTSNQFYKNRHFAARSARTAFFLGQLCRPKIQKSSFSTSLWHRSRWDGHITACCLLLLFEARLSKI